uniref:MATA-HMG n=1 Tax=Rhizophagus irregularis TaxID=588596 RepID=A0A1B1EU58_9GLOM|nr:MATA-HMG [Rhizophagus irregularis]
MDDLKNNKLFIKKKQWISNIKSICFCFSYTLLSFNFINIYKLIYLLKSGSTLSNPLFLLVFQ